MCNGLSRQRALTLDDNIGELEGILGNLLNFDVHGTAASIFFSLIETLIGSKSYNVSRIISLVLFVTLASYNGHQKTYCMSYTGYQSNSEFIIK